MKNAVLVVLIGALAAACTVRSQTVVERPVAPATATVITTDPPPPPPPPATVVVRER
jgi:hypothetical protein